MSRYMFAILSGVACAASAAAVQDARAQTQALPMLTREEALSRALGNDPRVDAAREMERAAEAGARQAGRAPNPTLDILTENVSGSGPYRSSDRAETTYSFAQPLELGGDRSARKALAEQDIAAARATAIVHRLDLVAEIDTAFVDAQAAEATRLAAEDRLATVRELTSAAGRRVAAARDPLMAGERAQARLAEAEIDAESARRASAAARARLASYWGGDPDFAVDPASFALVSGDASAGPATAPDLALAEIEQQRAEARVKAERARSIPDPTFQAGWRQFNETDETALVFGLSVPLQIWDRNSAGVARARADLARAGYERAARERALERQRATLEAQLEIARLEVEALDGRILPHGEEALARAREGYALGGFSYLDVFETQRALADARQRRISALRSFHHARIALARLTGAQAEEFSQ